MVHKDSGTKHNIITKEVAGGCSQMFVCSPERWGGERVGSAGAEAGGWISRWGGGPECTFEWVKKT